VRSHLGLADRSRGEPARALPPFHLVNSLTQCSQGGFLLCKRVLTSVDQQVTHAQQVTTASHTSRSHTARQALHLGIYNCCKVDHFFLIADTRQQRVTGRSAYCGSGASGPRKRRGRQLCKQAALASCRAAATASRPRC